MSKFNKSGLSKMQPPLGASLEKVKVVTSVVARSYDPIGQTKGV